MTNFEKIKAMSIEQMAEFIIGANLLFANNILKGLDLPQLTEEEIEKAIVEHLPMWKEALESEEEEE